MKISLISAYFSLIALTFTALTLLKFESKRFLSYGFLVLALNIIINLLGIYGHVHPSLYLLRFIYGACFALYAWYLK